MVFSLLAYFFSMVTAFAVVMTLLVGFGDSQLRSSRLRYPAVAEVININRDTFAEAEKAKEAQKAAEAKAAEGAGADAIVAQGIQAWGHRA